MRRTWLGLGLGALVAVGTAGADVQGKGLTLEAAWQTALDSSLALRQADLGRARIEEALSIQRADGLPNLSAVGTYGFTSEVARIDLPLAPPGGGPSQITAGVRNRADLAAVVEQPLFTGFRTKHLTKALGTDLCAEGPRRRAIENALLFSVAQAYRAVQLNGLRRSVLEAAVARAEAHLAQIRSFHDAQQATAFDTLEVANRKLQLESDLMALAHDRSILRTRLAHAMGVDTAGEVAPFEGDPESGAPDAKSLSEPAEYQATALANRQELAQLDLAQRAQSFRIAAQRSSLFPQIGASAGYHLGRPGVDAFRDAWMGTYTAGVNARWRIWNGRRERARIAQARVDSAGIAVMRAQVVRDIRKEVAEAYEQLLTVRDRMDMQRRLVAQERTRYAITQDQYRHARATSLDLSVSATSLTSAELALKELEVARVRAELRMRYVTGGIGREGEREMGRTGDGERR